MSTYPEEFKALEEENERLKAENNQLKIERTELRGFLVDIKWKAIQALALKK